MRKVSNSARELRFRVGRPETSQGATIYPLATVAAGSRRLSTVRLTGSDRPRKRHTRLCSLFSWRRTGPDRESQASGDVRRTGLILAGQPPKHGEGPLDVSPHRSLRGLCVAFEDRRQDEFMIRVAQR